jgi:nucleotide-binding universal stress UspA family protein
MGYRSVLVGTDGSESAERAVEHAAALARSFGARLTILTAFAPTPADDVQRAQQEAPVELRWMLTDAAQAEDRAGAGKELADRLGVDDVRTRVSRGDPAEALVETADDIGADVIVVGSKGMTGAGRFLLGSVPNRVSHHAPCDLLIVHTV